MEKDKNSIFHSKWYILDHKIKKNMHLMIIMASKRIKILNAAGIRTNLNTFLQVLIVNFNYYINMLLTGKKLVINFIFLIVF